MPIAYGFEGDQGTYSTPMESDFGLIKQAVIWNPDTKASSLAIATNGKMSLVSGFDDPSQSQIAQFTAPVALVFSEDDEFEQQYLSKFAKAVFSGKLKELLDWRMGNTRKLGQLLDGQGNPQELKPSDYKFESENIIPQDKGIFYFDRSRCIIGFDALYLDRTLSEVQFEIQEYMHRLRISPRVKTIGYGLYQADKDNVYKLMRRPNCFIRLSANTVVRSNYTKFDYTDRQMKVTAYYTYMAALALWAFVERVDLTSDGWIDALKQNGKTKLFPREDGNDEVRTIHDYVAYVTMLLIGTTGIGETTVERNYDITSIANTLKHSFGWGYTQANRRLWNFADSSNWKRYYLFCIMFGFAMARVKPMSADLQVTRYMQADRFVSDRLEKANHGNIASFGSITSLHLLTPNNTLTLKGKSTVPMPTIVDDMLPSDRNTVMKRANVYDDLRTERVPKTYQTLEVVKGEIPPNTIDNKSLDQKRYVLKPSLDARIVETELEERNVLRYSFPTEGMLGVVNATDDRAKRELFVLGLLTNGSRTLSEGTIIGSSLTIFKGERVRYLQTKFGGEVRVEKSDTDTTGAQQPKPTAGMSGGKTVIDSTTTNLQQPPTVPTAPELPKKTEVASERNAQKEVKSDNETQIPADGEANTDTNSDKS